MKVVLTGGTGFVGGELLTQLIAHPDISFITCLTRRPLPVQHPKVRALIHADFASYPRELIAELSDHEASLWALGGKSTDFCSFEEQCRVTHGYTLALASALAASTSRFKFCYLSGMGADPRESSWLPWERATRHLKGRTERDLASLSETAPAFAAYCFRPGGIVHKDSGLWAQRLLGSMIVRVDVLARAMIRVALHGAPHATILHREIRALGA